MPWPAFTLIIFRGCTTTFEISCPFIDSWNRRRNFVNLYQFLTELLLAIDRPKQRISWRQTVHFSKTHTITSNSFIKKTVYPFKLRFTIRFNNECANTQSKTIFNSSTMCVLDRELFIWPPYTVGGWNGGFTIQRGKSNWWAWFIISLVKRTKWQLRISMHFDTTV